MKVSQMKLNSLIYMSEAMALCGINYVLPKHTHSRVKLSEINENDENRTYNKGSVWGWTWMDW